MANSDSGGDERGMRRAIEAARKGQGLVEPNPMVGCLIVGEYKTQVSEGFHHEFGGAHAEIEAIEKAKFDLEGATMFVTLEPCCHQGKTPPCTEAIIAAGLGRVIVGCEDPFAQVNGEGLARLKDAGIEVQVGILEAEARQLISPYTKRLSKNLPWVIAKWAMTLDGKIATVSGDSQWISNEKSRSIVHQIRGRMDAVLIGSGTAVSDDPMLTARPTGPRIATRVVVDSNLQIDFETNLVKTAKDIPVIIATGPDSDPKRAAGLQELGVEIIVDDHDKNERLENLMRTLAERGMTNVLVEGGGELLGSLFQMNMVDEVHVFVAPKLLGGADAPGPVAGIGIETISDALQLDGLAIDQVGEDVHIHGRIVYQSEN